jgi:hypothetical protein
MRGAPVQQAERALGSRDGHRREMSIQEQDGQAQHIAFGGSC